MTLRSRLLFLLLPPLIAFVGLISLFFYYNWRQEIVHHFDDYLRSIVAVMANSLPLEEVQELQQQLLQKEPEQVKEGDPFAPLYKRLWRSKEDLGLHSLFLLAIEQEGSSPILRRYLLKLAIPYEEMRGVGSAWQQAGPLEDELTMSYEKSLYATQRPLVTSPYWDKESERWLIRSYAPVMDGKGKIVAILGADLPMERLDQQLRRASLLIGLSAIANIALVVLSVLFAAQQMVEPVQRLKEAAIEIAAGHYGYSVELHSPLELAALANTLNTMSECLQEQQEQQRRERAVEEQLFGEQECARLLQKKMFDDQLERLAGSSIELRGFRTQEASSAHGVYLQLLSKQEELLYLRMSEGERSGFNALFQLLSTGESSLWAELTLNLPRRIAQGHRAGMAPPLHWSRNREELEALHRGGAALEEGDLLFIASHSLEEVLGGPSALVEWLSWLLHHFGTEDRHLLSAMLDRHLHLLCDHPRFEKDLFLLMIWPSSMA